MCNMIAKYHVAPRPADANAWLLFRDGKVAMTIQGIYMLADLQKQQGLEYAGAPVPTLGPIRTTMGGSHMLCQPAGASPERSRAAWRLMRFLTDHSYEWAAGGQVAARSDVLQSEQFKNLPVQSQFAREVAYVQYEPQAPKGPSLSQFVDPAIEACLDGLQSPEEAMRDADRRIDQLLSRN
jgi:multiple sugar transport system substrate-binding protein